VTDASMVRYLDARQEMGGSNEKGRRAVHGYPAPLVVLRTTPGLAAAAARRGRRTSRLSPEVCRLRTAPHCMVRLRTFIRFRRPLQCSNHMGQSLFLAVPTSNFQRIQHPHPTFLHLLCSLQLRLRQSRLGGRITFCRPSVRPQSVRL